MLGKTEIARALLPADGAVVQVALDVMITLTWSPLTSVLEVNVGAFVPVITPFICHWYVGADPPLVGVAVNVTAPPEQIEVDEALMVTEGVTELVFIVITLLVAVAVIVQLAFDVMITLS